MSLVSRIDSSASQCLDEVGERRWAGTLRNHKACSALSAEEAHAWVSRPEHLRKKRNIGSSSLLKDVEVGFLGRRALDSKSWDEPKHSRDRLGMRKENLFAA